MRGIRRPIRTIGSLAAGAIILWLLLVPCYAGQVLELSYGTSPSQTLSACLPSDGLKARPGVLMIHGGGWTGGDKAPMGNLCGFFARNGIVAVSINYRLANIADPSTRWPAQLDDAEAAFQWMVDHSGELGLDPGRISVYGLSAGGHIAVWMAIKDKRVVSVIDGFGPVDLFKAQRDKRYQRSLTALIGDPQDAAAARALSPVYSVHSDMPPVLIIQGEWDKLVLPEQSQALYEALKSKNVSANMVMYQGDHSWKGLSPQERNSINMQAVSFIKSAPRRGN